MKRVVKILAIVQVILLAACALVLLLDRDARPLLWEPLGAGSQRSGDRSGRRSEPSTDRTMSGSENSGGGAASAASGTNRRKMLGEAALHALTQAGSKDTVEAEVERRIAEFDEVEARTNEVKRAEEQRRMDEAADSFEGLVPHHPDNAAKVREILNRYIELRFATYGEMEEIDPEFARSERESLRQTLGDRLLSEVPPAQGVTVLKKLFI
jgi:hypothetical protein